MAFLSDSQPSYGPPARRKPSPSICNRVLNWVCNLGVAVTGAARVKFPADDLRPRAKNVQITLDAVDDIRFCGNIFNNWMAELDKVPSDPNNQDGREQELRLYLGRLNGRAGLCLDATNEILQYHVQFASLMAQRFDDASKSQYDLRDDDLETTRLAKDIRDASSSLSTNLERMKHELDSFVSILKEQSMVKQILTIFATLFRSISGIVRHHPNSEPQDGKESEILDSVITSLRDVIPNEAKKAQKKLERSDKALEITERMRADQQMNLCGSDTAAVAEEWRDVAKQYQLAIEQESSGNPVSASEH